jgi:hypothetical protein
MVATNEAGDFSEANYLIRPATRANLKAIDRRLFAAERRCLPWSGAYFRTV